MGRKASARRTKVTVRKQTKAEQFNAITHEYMTVHGVTSVDFNDVYEWAAARGDFKETPIDRKRYFVHQLSRAARQDRWVDPQGRDVRRMHPAPYVSPDGQMHWVWAEITHAKPEHMRISLTVRRDGIRYSVKQHQMDLLSYNDNNVYGEKLQLFDYDFNKDALEMDMPEVWSEDEDSAEDQES